MQHQEELKKHLELLDQSKVSLKLAQEVWNSRNQMFNEWIQVTLGIKEQKVEMHLAEVLTKWDTKSNDKSNSESNTSGT